MHRRHDPGPARQRRDQEGHLQGEDRRVVRRGRERSSAVQDGASIAPPSAAEQEELEAIGAFEDEMVMADVTEEEEEALLL